MILVSDVNPLQKLLDFLSELDRRRIFYRLGHSREDAVTVEIAVPSARWEVEFFANGQVEVEIFKSEGGVIGDEEAGEALARLLREDEEAERALGRQLPWEQRRRGQHGSAGAEFAF